MMPFDPKSMEMRRRRFRPIPVRMLVPNVITLLAICAGLTAIRLSTEGHMELAVAAIVFAAVLDGIDGRVARMIKGQSKFGAELDSLADFVNFGVAPGLILYFWQLHELNNGGWIAAMVFAISGGLRLARFNATMDDPNKPPFAVNYFTGVPAPAGAIIALLPVYLAFLGLPKPPATLTALYTLLIAFLMVSRLPVFSGKTIRMRVPPEMVLPVFVSVRGRRLPQPLRRPVSLRRPQCRLLRRPSPRRPRTIGRSGCTERDDFSSNRHPALSFCLSMIFSENRCPPIGS